MKQAQIELNENALDHKRKIIILKSTTLFTAEARKYIAVEVRRYEGTKRSTGLALWVGTQGN